MKLKLKLKMLALAVMLASAPIAYAAKPIPVAQTVAQKAFGSPDEATKALADAVRADDQTLLLTIVGPSSKQWLSSGDEVADRSELSKFLAAYDAKNSVVESSGNRAVLLVGEDGWPFPAPLVRKEAGWVFDANAGREEIINRRVGRNELNTIQTLLAIVDAQREYAADDMDSNGFNDYAQQILSTQGKKDGLFWPAQGSEPQSPLGPQVAAAALQGYGKQMGGAKSGAYQGYRFKVLTAQGKNAPGGAFNYLVGNKMIGGFAVVAYPAKYGVSGVMTFLVNHDGKVYEKNLGGSTEAVAVKMSTFNPDAGWKKTP